MGFVDRFERRLQGVVGDAFARVFGGAVVPAEVEAQLRQEAAAGVTELEGGHLLAPNRYTITVSSSDTKTLSTDLTTATRAFSRHLADYLTDQGWETYGPVIVDIETSDALHTGQFRTAGVVDPDVESAPAPQQAPAQPLYSDAAYAREHGPASAQPTAYQPAVSVEPDYREQYAPNAVSLILEDGSGRHFQLRRGTNIVGRGQDAQFRLPDTGVSRRHMDIRWDGQVAILSDLGSTNGTMVNGSPVQDWQLADGDVIRIGHSEIVVRFS